MKVIKMFVLCDEEELHRAIMLSRYEIYDSIEKFIWDVMSDNNWRGV